MPDTNPIVGQPTSVTVAAPPSPPDPQVQSPNNGPDQIPNPPPQLQNMQKLPMQYQPTVPTGGDKWHQAVRALLGTSTQYRPSDPNNPNSPPAPYEVQNKPGQLFRSILAGAILGAGAGTSNAEHNAGSGWGAAGAGAAAVQKNNQQQQQQRQQQAQQQFENQRQVDQDQQEELRRKAEIAVNNAQTMRINQAMQGTDFDQHVKIADVGRAGVKPYEDAGISPVASNISESQMHQYVQDHPEASVYDWEPVSVKTVLTKDKDGNEVPSYESVYSAYDPKGKVTVPPSTIAEWKKAGVFDRYPEYEAALSNNKTLPANTYVQVKGDANKVIADNLVKQKQQGDLLMDDAKLKAVQAETKQRLAAAYNDQMSAREKTDQDNKQKALDTAWAHFGQAGNDPSKAPMTAEDRITLARNAQPLIQDSLKAISVAAADQSQQDQLPQLWNNYHSLSRLAQLGGASGGDNPPPPPNPENIPAGATIAVNPQTGEKRYSVDGGKTWKTPAVPINPVQTVVDRVRTLSPHDREMALSDPKISLADEDKARRVLGIELPDDSKYDKDISVQRQIKRMKGTPPDQIENKLSDFDFTPGQLEAVVRGVKREELNAAK